MVDTDASAAAANDVGASRGRWRSGLRGVLAGRLGDGVLGGLLAGLLLLLRAELIADGRAGTRIEVLTGLPFSVQFLQAAAGALELLLMMTILAAVTFLARESKRQGQTVPTGQEARVARAAAAASAAVLAVVGPEFLLAAGLMALLPVSAAHLGGQRVLLARAALALVGLANLAGFVGTVSLEDVAKAVAPPLERFETADQPAFDGWVVGREDDVLVVVEVRSRLVFRIRSQDVRRVSY